MDTIWSSKNLEKLLVHFYKVNVINVIVLNLGFGFFSAILGEINK